MRFEAPHAVSTLVAGRPFSADIEFTHREGEQSYSGKGFRARDSQGRQRWDRELAPGLTIVHIIDPPGQRTYYIDPASRTFSERSYPPEQQQWGEIPASMPDEPEKRMVEGVPCFRSDLMLNLPDSARFVTVWTCLDVGVVAEEYKGASGVTGSWTLRNLKLAEPSPELFKPPAGYRLTAMRG